MDWWLSGHFVAFAVDPTLHLPCRPSAPGITVACVRYRCVLLTAAVVHYPLLHLTCYGCVLLALLTADCCLLLLPQSCIPHCCTRCSSTGVTPHRLHTGCVGGSCHSVGADGGGVLHYRPCVQPVLLSCAVHGASKVGGGVGGGGGRGVSCRGGGGTGVVVPGAGDIVSAGTAEACAESRCAPCWKGYINPCYSTSHAHMSLHSSCTVATCDRRSLVKTN